MSKVVTTLKELKVQWSILQINNNKFNMGHAMIDSVKEYETGRSSQSAGGRTDFLEKIMP